MRCLLRFLCLLPALLSAAEEAPWTSRLAGFLSPELRDLDAAAAAARAELAALPPAPSDQSTERKGWHSSFSRGPGSASAAKGLRLDFGRTESFDAVVLVPVNIAYGSYPGPGFGFPVRFRVEAADDPAFSLPRILADHTAADFPNPGSLPVFIAAPGTRARYVRITATRLFARERDALFVLGEVMVMRGAVNLAPAAAVTPTDAYDNTPTWQAENVNDGQSILGPPLATAPSPGNGYHAEIAKSADTVKWVQFDLGRPLPLDEIRLYAARPVDFAVKPGFGFPLRFRVEAGDSPDMDGAAVLAEFRDRDCVNPGDNPFPVPARGLTARYVRITAARLWRRDDFVFALSEVQIFSGGRNVAPSAEPSALDNLVSGQWDLPHIHDGYTSQGRLLDWSEWLRGLSDRRETALRLTDMERRRGPLLEAAWRRLWWGLAAAAGLFLVLLSLWVSRQRRQRRIEVRRLRTRIAADLHDEIGSNLANIALLSRLSLDHGGSAARADLVEINRIATETADSMRDIVWLMKPGDRSAMDLVIRMREIAGRLLPDIECRFEAGEITGPFPLDFERQTLLLFKEALNNIRRHSGASRVTISVTQRGHEFLLCITDDGVGFDAAAHFTGIGLGSMRDRAGAVGGALDIRTAPAGGTVIRLLARLS